MIDPGILVAFVCVVYLDIIAWAGSKVAGNTFAEEGSAEPSTL